MSHIRTRVRIAYLLLDNVLTESSVQTELDSFIMNRYDWAIVVKLKR